MATAQTLAPKMATFIVWIFWPHFWIVGGGGEALPLYTVYGVEKKNKKMTVNMKVDKHSSK